MALTIDRSPILHRSEPPNFLPVEQAQFLSSSQAKNLAPHAGPEP